MNKISLIGILAMVVMLLTACNDSMALSENTESDTISKMTTGNISASTNIISVSIQKEKLDVYLLTQNHCSYCAKALKCLKELEGEFPINVIEINIQNRSNLSLCTEICSKYGVHPRGVPALFLDKYWMVGWPINAEALVRNAIEEYYTYSNVDIDMAGLEILEAVVSKQ